uniref:Uncharacterized protein n=1 Tax=Anguilla anguilla TaxID=7936 RepID=A0A0E9P7M0_ANGAN
MSLYYFFIFINHYYTDKMLILITFHEPLKNETQEKYFFGNIYHASRSLSQLLR